MKGITMSYKKNIFRFIIAHERKLKVSDHDRILEFQIEDMDEDAIKYLDDKYSIKFKDEKLYRHTQFPTSIGDLYLDVRDLRKAIEGYDNKAGGKGHIALFNEPGLEQLVEAVKPWYEDQFGFGVLIEMIKSDDGTYKLVVVEED